MMLTAAGSSSLDGLLELVEYVKDAKNRIKELKELRDARDIAIKEREAVEKAHHGAEMLAEAEKMLAKAQGTVSTVLAKAKKDVDQLVADANGKVGNLIGMRKDLDTLSEKLNKDRTSFDKTSTETIKELERREHRARKKENDNNRNREELAQDRSRMQEKSRRVINAMKE